MVDLQVNSLFSDDLKPGSREQTKLVSIEQQVIK
jgi:hypothetical protein